MDLGAELWEAWEVVGPWLLRDRAELVRRLARRRTMALRRPPRAWCLVVRAGDTRLLGNPVEGDGRAETSRLSLDARLSAGSAPSPLSSGAQRVWLDAYLLRELCAPVQLEPPGETMQEVAAKLGVTIGCLLTARVKGILRTHHRAGLGGKHGHPVPLLFSNELLDPAAPMFVRPHAIWNWTWLFMLDRIPGELGQGVTRVPHFQSQVSAKQFEERHPEVDGVGKKRARLLPRGGPDLMAWYKWKGEEYIGYDWRAAERNPAIKRRYEAAERRRERDRLRKRAAYEAHPRKRGTSGSLQFDGWRWICPVCGKKSRTIYYPLPRVNLLGWLLEQVAAAYPTFSFSELCSGIEPLVQGFACSKCHGVKHPGMTDAAVAWNYFISHLTGGLLYGHEVRRPAEFVEQRKRAQKPRLGFDAGEAEDRAERVAADAGKAATELAD